MKFPIKALALFIGSALTAPTSSMDLSLSKIKEVAGDGGANNIRFSSVYTNADGSTCAPCILCPGSRLNSLFDPKVKSICVDCSKSTDSCSRMKFISTFEKEWKMKFFSLTSSEVDASM